MKILMFRATEKYKYHNDIELGRVDDGDIVQVSDGVAEKLMKDFPENWVDLEQEREQEKEEKKAPKKSQKKGVTKEVSDEKGGNVEK